MLPRLCPSTYNFATQNAIATRERVIIGPFNVDGPMYHKFKGPYDPETYGACIAHSTHQFVGISSRLTARLCDNPVGRSETTLCSYICAWVCMRDYVTKSLKLSPGPHISDHRRKRPSCFIKKLTAHKFFVG